MIDFNALPDPPADADPTARREEIRAALLARLESVLFTLFPAGKKRRGKFVIGDVLGSPGDSLEVVLDGDKAGLWTDRAEGSGGDVFHLIGAHFGVDVHGDFARVLDLAEDLVGRALTAPPRKAAKKAPVDDLGRLFATWLPPGTISSSRGPETSAAMRRALCGGVSWSSSPPTT
ncbi:hypothetical protein [Thermomonas hydrothermalis]|uniref:hypothetical protein n=1 Tax=Thermomonas hydrothermalis TaxID=213588 RepID=UPI002355C4D2|nr:hypothetical protein [Thermomonas hydrothermalis]